MKVALIGNMNNNFFSLMRYLRERNIDAYLLVLDDDPKHFLPSADTNTDDKYIKYIRYLNWGKRFNFLKVKKEIIKEDVKNFDKIIACGTAMAFLHKINKEVDIFIPYGADFYKFPFFRFQFNIYQLNYFLLARNQKKSIQNSKYFLISSNIYSPVFYEKYKKLNYNNKLINIQFPYIYENENENEYINNWTINTFNLIRENNELIILHHSRHIWKNSPNMQSNKRNDILIKGYAKLVKNKKNKKIKLILFEYGSDVHESKKLIKELKIENHVFWFPLSQRKEIVYMIKKSDIIASEFAGLWITGGTLAEAQYYGKVVLNYTSKELINKAEGNYCYFVNCENDDEINNHLSSYLNDSTPYLSKAKNAQICLKKKFEETIYKIIEILNN